MCVKNYLNILAAEDNQDCQAMLNLVLKKMGHQVTFADDGVETIEKLNHHEYDLILMDLQMPNLNGFDTTDYIRNMDNEKSNIPIVALTANNYESDLERCYQAGMNDFMAKPINLKNLKDLLSKWTQKIGKNDYN